ncbi:hypothetical protein [Aeribacillus sp. FSL k6-2211]|uniref:hypothetical protein n=1 Tax=Aeribacillus sp. FSL k6-2211 TaxID=2954608 RepID=UPI0030CE8FE9
MVKVFLRQEGGIVSFALSATYSSQLNSIERLWKWLKWILTGPLLVYGLHLPAAGRSASTLRVCCVM